MTTLDVLSSGDTPRPGAPQPWRTVSRSTAVVALGVAIALLLTTGVTAVVRLSGGGPQPEEALPASTFAFAKLDLDPPASQKLAVRALAKRFPDAPGDDLDAIRDDLAEGMVDQLGLDYADDVEPWLGDRFAVAGFVSGDDAQVIVAVQVRDEDAARRAVAKARRQRLAGTQNPIGVTISAGTALFRGYLLLGQDQPVVDDAVRQATTGSLGGSSRFAGDLSRLSGDQIAVGWADNGQLYDRVFSSVVTELEMDATAHDPRAGISGRSVVGLHATRRYVELESIAVDATPAAGSPADPSMLTSLPTTTTAVVLLTNPAAFRASSAAYSAFGAIGGAGLLGLGLGAFPFDDSEHPLETIITALEPLDHELETELLPLLRGSTAVALGPLPGGASSRSDASLMLVADVAAPGNAEIPLQHARDALRRAGLTADVAIRGGRVFAATGSAYVDDLGDPGRLGEGAVFRDAMGPLDDGLRLAAYLDVAALARTQPDFPEELAPVLAVGVTSTDHEHGSTTRLRIVIG